MLQCEARQRILNMKSRKLSDEEKDKALWLLHILTKRAIEHNPSIVNEFDLDCVETAATKGNHQVSGVSVVPQGVDGFVREENEGDSDTASTIASMASNVDRSGDGILPPPTYDEFIKQIPDYPEIVGYEAREERRMRIVRAVQACYRKVLKASTKKMLAILRVENLNAFNLRSPERLSVGWIVYPQASMMNHSCYPNSGCTSIGNHLVFETLRDVEAGEECLQSYLGNESCCEHWGFTCHCEKCRDIVDPAEWARFEATFRCVCGCLVPNANAVTCHCQDGLMLSPVQASKAETPIGDPSDIALCA